MMGKLLRTGQECPFHLCLKGEVDGWNSVHLADPHSNRYLDLFPPIM